MSQEVLKPLKDIAFVRNVTFSGKENSNVGEQPQKEYSYIIFKDIPRAGFLTTANETKSSHYSLVEKETLHENDILISIRGNVAIVAIVGASEKALIPSQAFALVRMNNPDDAIAMYMYLKSNRGQKDLMMISLIDSNRVLTIKIKDLQELLVPSFSDKEKIKIADNFHHEINLYKDIEDIEEKIRQLNTQF